MMLRIEPGVLHGTVSAPPSKSCAHRALLCAAMSEGDSTVRSVSESGDIRATLDCVSALGRRWERNGSDVTVSGKLSPCLCGAVFPCRESGSTLRFLLPVTLAIGGSAVFTGSRRLLERGIGVYETLFAEKAISVVKTADSVFVRGSLHPGEYTIPGNISSQFVSGLLFALPLLSGDSMLNVLPPIESRPYIGLTLDAMRDFAISIDELPENRYYIPGRQRYQAADVAVEGDWSNAAVLFALRSMGHDLSVTGLTSESRQGDRVCPKLLQRLDDPKPVIDLSDCPDLGPVLFAAAAAKHGAVFTGTRRLQIKESDRTSAMAEELRKFGIRMYIEENRVTVFSGKLRRPSGPLSGHNDHRIVMALTLLCTLTGGEIAGAEAVGKSWPDFFPTLESAGLRTVCSETLS